MKGLTFLFYFTLVWALIGIVVNLGIIAFSLSLSKYDGLFEYVIYFANNLLITLYLLDKKPFANIK